MRVPNAGRTIREEALIQSWLISKAMNAVNSSSEEGKEAKSITSEGIKKKYF